MIHFLTQRFIENYDDYKNQKVRQAYGTLCSILSIICNIVLVIFKITIGLIVHSVAIQADGLNNLSDVGSNLASLFGFKLANKHPDKDHPYGHGRYEYIAGMVIAFLILVVGIQSLKESVVKIFNPEKVMFSFVAVVILIFSIFSFFLFQDIFPLLILPIQCRFLHLTHQSILYYQMHLHTLHLNLVYLIYHYNYLK